MSKPMTFLESTMKLVGHLPMMVHNNDQCWYAATQTLTGNKMIDVQDILSMHRKTVDHWHDHPIANEFQGILGDICQQHQFNFLLWHEEDKARSTDADDSLIADVKRAIDGYNQQRNDWIEKVDDRITEMLAAKSIEPQTDARLNSETPGSIIDRMSIMALRIYHMDEQLARTDATPEHLEKVQNRMAVCLMQLDDLANCLDQLLKDIFAGRFRHRTYRQMKMYNDPTMNPYLYKAKNRPASV